MSLTTLLSFLLVSYSSSTFKVRVTSIPLVRIIPFEFTSHHVLTISSEQVNKNAQVVLDFLPLDRSNILTIIALLMGQSKPGQIRQVVVNEELMSSQMSSCVDQITNSWNTDINIYNNNCQHFSDHVIRICEQTKAENQ